MKKFIDKVVFSKTLIPHAVNAVFWITAIAFFYAHIDYLQTTIAPELTALEQARFNGIAQSKFDRTGLIPLDWDKSVVEAAEPFVNARSAIVIDMQSGSILFEQNADEIIPPASMTKIVGMFVVFEEIANGNISLDDYVPLPPESWWVNAPPHSSLMFLNDGHIVTLQEILLGLNISSGNDAAVALANFVSGSMDAFIKRMNEAVQALGLTQTFFVDSSGYSAKNTTTAREFAEFARMYVQKYPETLELFHSVPSIAYPQNHNLPPWRVGKDLPIVQYNTNPTLGKIEGVTGLKTGFIDESGYNLSLTVERGNTKILSVTMGGPGTNAREGNYYRLEDCNAIVDYAYENFKTVSFDTAIKETVPVLAGDKKLLFAQEAWQSSKTIPSVAKTFSRDIELEPYIQAPVKQGDVIGTVTYSADDLVVQKVPLLADRTIEKSGFFQSCIDFVVAIVL